MIQGQVTLSRDGVEKTFNVGDSFTEIPGQTLQAFNRGSTDVIVAATFGGRAVLTRRADPAVAQAATVAPTALHVPARSSESLLF